MSKLKNLSAHDSYFLYRRIKRLLKIYDIAKDAVEENKRAGAVVKGGHFAATELMKRILGVRKNLGVALRWNAASTLVSPYIEMLAALADVNSAHTKAWDIETQTEKLVKRLDKDVKNTLREFSLGGAHWARIQAEIQTIQVGNWLCPPTNELCRNDLSLQRQYETSLNEIETGFGKLIERVVTYELTAASIHESWKIRDEKVKLLKEGGSFPQLLGKLHDRQYVPGFLPTPAEQTKPLMKKLWSLAKTWTSQLESAFDVDHIPVGY